MLRAILFRDYCQTVKSPIMIIAISSYLVMGYALELFVLVVSSGQVELSLAITVYSLFAFGVAGGLMDLTGFDNRCGVYNMVHQVRDGFMKYFFAKMALPVILTAFAGVIAGLLCIPYGLQYGFPWRQLMVGLVVAECLTVAFTALGLVIISRNGAQSQAIVAIGEILLLTAIDVIAVRCSILAAIALSVAFVLLMLAVMVRCLRGRYTNNLACC